MKTNNPVFFSLSSISRLFVLGISAVFMFPEPAAAQQQVQVQFSDYIYQGGRKKSARGIKLTTSAVSLPDLNAILSPSPLPKTQPVQSQKKPVVKKSTAAAAAANTSSKPRFGFGSGPVQPPAPADPRLPIDPGYDPVPQPAPAANNTGVPQTFVNPPMSQPSIRVQQTTTIPFAHGYYPRSYVPRIPYSYSPFGHYGYGCGLYPSRAPLRGSLTSSRNYLSGFGYRSSFGRSFFGISF